MIRTHILKQDDKPIAVLIDYKEYLRLKEIEEDRADYYLALKEKMNNKKWIAHKNVKKTLGL